MTVTKSTDVRNRLDCRFADGWAISVEGQASDPSFLVFVTQNGGYKYISNIINFPPSDDEKRFLNPDQMKELFAAVFELANRKS